MKKITKILSVMLAVVLTLTAAPLSGFVGLELPEWLDFSIMSKAATYSGICGDNLVWKYNIDTKTLTISGTGAMYDYDTNRPSWEEHYFKMQNIVINKGVTTIGAYAFRAYPSLKSVEIPYGISTIGESAFASTAIVDLIIPDSVTAIGDYAFSESALTGVVVFGEGIKIIGKEAFDNTCLTKVKIPDSVTTIGDGAFFGCNRLTEVIIGDGCTNIGANAFAECDDISILTLGDNISTIGVNAFLRCENISEVRIDELYDWCKISFTNAFSNPLCYADFLIVNGTSITSLNIPYNITQITDYAFYGYKNLRDVTINNPIIIGNYAFSNCPALLEATIGGEGTTIGNYAFSNCPALLEATIGGEGTTIGYYAFECCDNLLNINICNGVTRVNEGAFYWCKNLLTASINKSVKAIEECAFARCWNISDVFYSGSEDEWNKICFGISNDYLLNAIIHFNSTDTELEPDNSCDKLGHSYNAVVTEPNYTEDGYTTYTCMACGDSYISDYTSKTALSFTEDIYSFKNGYDVFTTGNYTISDAHFEKLCSYVEANVNSKDEYDSIESMLIYFREKKKWSGSCYGMAVTVLLDKLGKISFNENFDSNAKTMFEVDSPLLNTEVMSAINYYHSAQYIPFIKDCQIMYFQDSSDWSAGLRSIVDKAEEGKIFIFNFGCRKLLSAYGHALVVTGYNKTEEGYVLNTYDCRYPGDYVTVNIDKSFKSCIITHIDESGKKIEEKAEMAGYIADFSGFDKIDIDGSNNQRSYLNNITNFKSINTTLYFPAYDGITIQNENGETLTYNNGVLLGSMKILSEKMIANSTVSGEDDVATIIVEVADGEKFEVISNSENIYVSFLTRKTFASVSAINAENIVFDQNQGVYIYGENVNYDISLTSNMNNTDMISICGESKADVSLIYENDAIIANGVDGNTCQVKVFSDTVNAENKNFISGYDSVMITAKSEEYGDVDILASSNGDGVYDQSVMNNFINSFSIRTPSRTSIRYKDSIILHVDFEGELPKGSKIIWYITNDNFDAGYLDDGMRCVFVSKNNGYTTIYAVIEDANGNELAVDSIELRSKAGFFDKIGGFFRSLFGTTKIYQN